MTKKNQGLWTAVGTILIIFGVVWNIAFYLKGNKYLPFLILTTISVIIGVLLIAWTWSDEDEYESLIKKKYT